ncbi:MAG: hypothetical protein SNJ82_03030 [Gemmataceae bacterium]
MPALEREEYVEQAYLFRVLRERLADGIATQTILETVDQELLSTTRLPLAVQFLTGEIKHTGLLSSGFARLSHYFTPFQAFVLQGAEDERLKFSIETALLILEREATYRAGNVSPAGLFVFQFETISRNKLGYEMGLRAMRDDAYYDADWREFLDTLKQQLGLVDFADILYARSHLYVNEMLRIDPDYDPPVPPLFGEKEGKIAKANRGRDPLYLFAALQRHLGYPEVPRVKEREDLTHRIETLMNRIRDLETRLRLMEMEQRGTLDLSKLIDPEKLLPKDDDW